MARETLLDLEVETADELVSGASTTHSQARGSPERRERNVTQKSSKPTCALYQNSYATLFLSRSPRSHDELMSCPPLNRGRS